VTRRGLLIGAGVIGGGLLLGWRFGVPEAQLKIAEALDGASAGFAPVPTDPNAWFEVTPDNRVRLFITKVEMGQGIKTSLAQIAAEELGVAPNMLDVQQASTNQGFSDSTGTAGSSSVSSLYKPLREAAANLREMLRAEAAKALGVPAASLTVDGMAFVASNDSSMRVDFGQLVSNQKTWQAPKDAPALKTAANFNVIGQPVQRIDVPDKVTGKAIYGYDVRVPGMLYGAVLRPPTIAAKLKSVTAGSAESIEGVKKVVIDVANGFAGVVATSRMAAQRGVAALQAEWDTGKLWQQDEIDALVTAGGGTTIQRVGNAPAQLGSPTVTGEYRSPFAIQTPLEAQAAMADVKADSAKIYSSTQSQFSVRRYVAQAVGLKEEQVEVQTTNLGGGFGRKSGWEAAVEAARLSKAAGVPVHVAWSRQEELQNGYFRPPTDHKLSAKIDNGRITAWQHDQASGDVLFAFFPAIVKTAVGADFGATRAATIKYDVPNRLTVAKRVDLPVKTGPWRGLGLLANAFAVESFMDELARAANADPLQFRLDHMPKDDWGRRMEAVLRAAADKGEWGKPAPEGRARGIACTSDVDTVVAQVAEISLDRTTGKINVHRIALAMDCGLAVNPDGIGAQAEGSVMWGVGSALIEEMQIKDGQVTPRNFDTYPLLTIADAPAVDVVLVDTLKDGEPRGVGEPPMGPTAAAIGNAFFALTGKRLRQMPFTPARVLAALNG
jgi:isoquinoline 1-oxidoreductase beta subunit